MFKIPSKHHFIKGCQSNSKLHTRPVHILISLSSTNAQNIIDNKILLKLKFSWMSKHFDIEIKSIVVYRNVFEYWIGLSLNIHCMPCPWSISCRSSAFWLFEILITFYTSWWASKIKPTLDTPSGLEPMTNRTECECEKPLLLFEMFYLLPLTTVIPLELSYNYI